MISLNDIPPYIGNAQDEVSVAGWSLQTFIDDQAKAEGIDLDPDFQRAHVWAKENQTRYLQHLLRGGRSSRTLIWNCPGYNPHVGDNIDAPEEMVIVDGKQRLTAILAFLNNEVPVFDGHYFRDFSEEDQRRISSPTGQLRMVMQIHALKTRAEILQLYVELNEGAVAHTPEEIARVKQLLDEARQKPA